jgi:hypothetical protein
MRKAGLVAAVLVAALGTWTWASSHSDDDSSPDLSEGTYTLVTFEDPIPTGHAIKKKTSEEECTTGCSLAKHTIPPFTPYDFEKTLAAYAALPATEVSEELEKLLFYGARTKQLIEEVGIADLPAEHLAYLQKELTRDHAIVSLRMVDEDDVVRVVYGPTSVPIGAKQHLAPVGEDLQAMEFNGTVMRTGVNYLWSRY